MTTPPADLFDPAIRLEDPPRWDVPPGGPAARRGYPLPPWARDMREPASGAEVLRWLLEDVGAPQAAAYLEAQRSRYGDAYRRAIRAEEDLDDLTATVGQLRTDYVALEELYLRTQTNARPTITTELELDEAGLEVLRVTLAYEIADLARLNPEALERIVEAAAQAAHVARTRELEAAATLTPREALERAMIAAAVQTEEERHTSTPRLRLVEDEEELEALPLNDAGDPA